MAEQKRIRILPEVVATKIGAGEVVERPANAVKELMENAIDAGAKRIRLTITCGGRKLICVEDDGCGMDPDNLLQSLEQHATSKIRDVADIGRISTYGFRGEAIPSIASVSRMKISSRAEGFDHGKCVEVEGGTLVANTTIGFPGHGTTVEVRDIFFNMPARRKFLSSYYWEGIYIERRFIQQALSHPEIAMTLRSDGKDVYTLPADSSLEERIHGIFSGDYISHLLKVNHTSPDGRVSISGYIGDPSFTKSDASGQYVFINKRAATAEIIPGTIRDTYPKLEKRKPVFILFIDVPPSDLDVNVSPTKSQVKFCRKTDVRNALSAAIYNTLVRSSCPVNPALTDIRLGNGDFPSGGDFPLPDFSSVPQFIPSADEGLPRDNLPPAATPPEVADNGASEPLSYPLPPPPPPGGPQPFSVPPAMPAPAAQAPAAPVAPVSSAIPAATLSPGALPPASSRASGPSVIPGPVGGMQAIFAMDGRQQRNQSAAGSDGAPHAAPLLENPKYSAGTGRAIIVKSKFRPWSWVRVLGRLNNGYVLMDSSKPGFIILDPQAAHECVLYEDLSARASGAVVAVQPELCGYEVNLDPEDARIIAKHLGALKKMGFDIEEFDSCTSFKIDALPCSVSNTNVARLLSDIAANIKSSNVRKSLRDMQDELIVKAVAKAAVRLDSSISIPEIERLVERLASLRNPYVSPSGKPTMIEISTNDIDRRFDKNR